MNKALIASLLFCLIHSGYAQVQSGVNDGITFANTIAPTSPSQVVNPAGVNATQWNAYGSTNTPTAPPANMGAISNPNTSTSTYTSAASMGLSGVGNQAKFDCSNYVQGTDPNKDQQCAAVNYMNNTCLPRNASEQKVLRNAAVITGTSGNCQGTYGQSVSQFGYFTMTPSDPVFTNVNNAQSTAPSVFNNSVCTPVTTTTPAQYSTATCLNSITTNQYGCSQYLNTTVNTTYAAATVAYSCPNGVLVGNSCQAFSNGAPNTVYVCPVGYALNGSTCVGSTTINATVVTYSCPAGQSLLGSNCTTTTTTSTPATGVTQCPTGYTLLAGGICESTSTIGATTLYQCPAGYVLSGSICYGSNNIPATVVNACPTTAYATQSPVTNIGGYLYYWINPPVLACTGTCPAGTTNTYVYNSRNNFPYPQISSTTPVQRYGNYNSYPPIGDAGASACFPVNNQPCPTGTVPITVYASSGKQTVQASACGPSPTPIYTCPAGYTQYTPTTCLPPPTTATFNGYTCPSGATLSGTSCVTTNTTTATVSYSCPSGTLSGTDCIQTITTTSAATPNYTCPVDYTLSGSNCVGATTIPATIGGYTCPAGATLSGSTCITVTTIPATNNYSCADGSAPVNGVCTLRSVQSSWTDTCVTYETSAGSFLPTP